MRINHVFRTASVKLPSFLLEVLTLCLIVFLIHETDILNLAQPQI